MTTDQTTAQDIGMPDLTPAQRIRDINARWRPDDARWFDVCFLLDRCRKLEQVAQDARKYASSGGEGAYHYGNLMSSLREAGYV